MFKKHQKTIAILEINGVISATSSKNVSLSDDFDLSAILDFLAKLRRKSQPLDGIFLRLNTPGGTAGASEEIARSLEKVKLERHVPVVASIADICCSGGYMIACVADTIYANTQSLTGSIGTILQIPNYEELANKIGVRTITIKSGKMKDIGNPMRQMEQEEVEYLTDLAETGHLRFSNFVLKHRPDLQDIVNMMDGRPVDAPTAKENNLIDEFGTYSDAYDALLKKIGLSDDGLRNLKELRMKKKRSFLKRIFGSLTYPILPAELLRLASVLQGNPMRNKTENQFF